MISQRGGVMVVNCKTNYRKRKKDENNPESVTVHSFPKNLDDR